MRAMQKPKVLKSVHGRKLFRPAAMSMNGQLILKPSEARETIRAKALINSAGPWVSQVLGQVIGHNDPAKIRMVKGSHLVVDKLYDHDRCYIFQNADGRICFAIPYENNFTLIGTTDQDHVGDPGKPEISEAETDYLLKAVSEYFKKPVDTCTVELGLFRHSPAL